MAATRTLRASAPVLGAVLIGGATVIVARNSMQSRQLRAESNEPAKTFTSGFSFQELRLRSSEDVNHNTKRLRFDLPDPNAVSGLEPISALLTKANVNNSWLPTLRPYTPVSDPVQDKGFIDLLVKRYPDGKMSNHLHALKPGDTHSFKTGPLPTGFTWPPKNAESGDAHLALIAGGAGITPLYQLTKAVLASPPSAPAAPKVTLVFGVNTPADLLFRHEFRALEKQYPDRFKCVYAVSHPPSPSSDPSSTALEKEGVDYTTGYVTKELLKTYLPPPDANGGVKVLLCGPPGMEESVAGKKGWGKGVGGVLGELGYGGDQVVRL